MKDKKHITIKIAGQAFDLDIQADQERNARRVEQDVNSLWAKWCDRFHDREPHEILAMVTFQYARYYYQAVERQKANETALVEFDRQLDNLLLNIK